MIGAGSPYTRLALEWHYLMANDGRKGLKNIEDHFTDHSGIVLKLTPDLRRHSAATLGFIGGNMQLPPGHERFDYGIRTSAGKLETIIGHDLDKYGQVHPLAAHLHMHNHGRQAWIEQHRESCEGGICPAAAGFPKEMARIDTYKGYGVDQSFFLVDAESDPKAARAARVEAAAGHFQWSPSTEGIKAGDQLSMHCVFDTMCKYGIDHSDPTCEKATEPIKYGLSHGQEMCGLLLMYYPHDPTVRFPQSNVMGYREGDLDDVSADCAGCHPAKIPTG